MAKKGENIYKRKDGRWEGRYIKYRKPSGKIQYGYIYGKKYKDVKERLVHLKATQAESRKHSIVPDSLFLEWFESWMNKSLKKKVKPTTFSVYSNMAQNYLIPYFGKIRIRQLNKQKIQTFVNILEEQNLSSGYIRNVFNLLQKGLKEAERLGFIDQDLLKYVKLPKMKMKPVHALSLNEQQNLERAALKLDECSAIILALYSGMRIGEISGLKWSDIDFEQEVIYVKRTVYRISDIKENNKKTILIEGSPKTESSKRAIPMSKNLQNYLIEKKEKSDCDYVISSNGNCVEPRTINYRFKKLLKDADIKDIHFHSLRHTFATRCLEQGANIASLSRLLGHNSAKLTLDTYTDSMFENRRAVISAVDLLWCSVESKT